MTANLTKGERAKWRKQQPSAPKQADLCAQEKIATLRLYAGVLIESTTGHGDRIPLMRARARDLDISLRDGELQRLLWDARCATNGAAELLTQADEFDLTPSPWCWDGIVIAVTLNLMVSLPKIGKTSWKRRAEAYDRSRGKKGEPMRTAPVIPPPPQTPQSSSPAKTAQAVIPEMLGVQSTTALADSHLQVLSRYRKAYEALGSGMVAEAQALFPLVHAFRCDLELERQIWRQLLEQQEIERTILMQKCCGT
jgi:hypothetical protein